MLRMRLVERLDAIIREQVRPLERIESIKIMHVDGLAGRVHARRRRQRLRRAAAAPGGFAENVVNSALRYRAQAPLVDQLLKEIGVQGGDVGAVAQGLLAGAAAGRGRCHAGDRLRRQSVSALATTERSPADDQGLCLHRHGLARGCRLGRGAGLQRAAQWTPFVADSRIEQNLPADRIGCVRNFRLKDGGVIREQLLSLSDYDFQCTYSILESPMGVSELCRDPQADAGHRRQPDLRRMVGGIR